MIISRENDIQYLQSFYTGEENKCVVFYGLKSVGKTTILKEFVEDKPHLFLACQELSKKRIEQEFTEAFTRIGCPAGTLGIKDCLRYAGQASKGKFILVIDEFQYLFKEDASLFFEIFDYLKNSDEDSNILLVLSSGSMRFIENDLVSKIGSAVMDIDGFYKVRPFSYSEMVNALDLPGTYRYDLMSAYCILGGLIGRLSLWNFKISVRENILNIIKDYRCELFSQEVIMEELREPLVYRTILMTLAEGKNKLNDIHEKTGYSRSKISVYLKNLMDIGLVEKPYNFETPGNRNGQKGVYRISDPFIAFTYRFIYPHMSVRNEISAEEYYDEYIKDSLDSFITERVCDVFRTCMNEMVLNEKFKYDYVNMGEWIGKMGSIEFVAQDRDRHTLLGFVKWGSRITREDLEWYEFCARKAGRKPDETVYFCMHGFEADVVNNDYEIPSLFLKDLM